MRFPVIDCNSLNSRTNHDLTFSGKMSNNRNKMVIGLIMVSLYLNSLNKILHCQTAYQIFQQPNLISRKAYCMATAIKN